MMSLYECRRGDIVELVTYCFPKDPDRKQYNNLSQKNPHKLIILRKIENSIFLVALCKKTPKKVDLKLEASNKETLYVCADAFFSISEKFIRYSDCYFGNSQKAVDQIYQKHNEIVEAKIKAKELERQKKEETKRKEEAERKKIEKYAELYELAIMNNDKAKMNEIIKMAGCVPGQSSKGYATSKLKTVNKYVNPRPLKGGGFSPK